MAISLRALALYAGCTVAVAVAAVAAYAHRRRRALLDTLAPDYIAERAAQLGLTLPYHIESGGIVAIVGHMRANVAETLLVDEPHVCARRCADNARRVPCALILSNFNDGTLRKHAEVQFSVAVEKKKPAKRAKSDAHAAADAFIASSAVRTATATTTAANTSSDTSDATLNRSSQPLNASDPLSFFDWMRDGALCSSLFNNTSESMAYNSDLYLHDSVRLFGGDCAFDIDAAEARLTANVSDVIGRKLLSISLLAPEHKKARHVSIVDIIKRAGWRVFFESLLIGTKSLVVNRGEVRFYMLDGTINYCARESEKRYAVVVSLERILTWLNDRVIDFLKIDAQGMDLHVVLSAGRKLHLLKQIQMEVAMEDCPSLYVGAPKCYEIIAKMRDSGFIVSDEHGQVNEKALCTADGGRCERDLYFTRPGFDKYLYSENVVISREDENSE